MHEVAITQSIIDICKETARHQGAMAVRAVTVEIGELSGVVPEAVEFCFEACSRGTLL
ncbi:MAG: hydrogenase maturation nickel metallochaperone HypA, partial [Geoalkalibacter sp.]|uniref:hydrogenase maturation nickel metallochaperone HypA/HybF n=1 Tax=Geoalkalibacter sp. TaxID=3041440 RepID=UPI003D0D0A89